MINDTLRTSSMITLYRKIILPLSHLVDEPAKYNYLP